MASNSMKDSVLLKESVIRGHHVYKSAWTPRLGETLQVRQETWNSHDGREVALLQNQVVVSHVPGEFSKVFWHFLDHGGIISCEVTGKGKYCKGLEVPCVYKFISSGKNGNEVEGHLQVIVPYCT